MGLVWNVVALPGLIAAVLSVIAAVLVYTMRAGARANRAATVVLVGGGALSGLAYGLRFLAADAATAYAFFATGVMLGGCLLLVGVPWLCSTWRTPLVRPFATPLGRVLPLLAAALLLVLALARPTLLLVEFVWSPRFAAWVLRAPGPVLLAGSALLVTSVAYASAAALTTWRAGRGSSSERSARSIAFGFGSSLFIILFALLLLAGGRLVAWPALRAVVGVVFVPAATVVLLVFLTYGMMNAQMFDIDLKLKWTIRQSTVVAVIFAGFIGVSELFSNMLSDAVGAVAGGITAATMLFALTPLQRAAAKLARAAMPGVRATPEYEAARKRAVYLAAVEGAGTDGEISDSDRAILIRLQLELGIANEEARTLEAQVAGRPLILR